MPKGGEYRILLAAICGTFMVMLDQTIMNVALPHIMAVFNETAERAQLVISAYLMATAVTTPAAAFLGARFGMKRVFLFSQATFLLGSVLCGLAWNTSSLITFRVLQGLSGGLLGPIAMTLVFVNVPPEERGTAMAIFGIPMMLAPAIGPTLGGYLVDQWSWRMCFYVNVPVVMVAILLGLVWIEETPPSKITLDIRGFVLAAVGFNAILYAFSYAPTWGWHEWRILGMLLLGTIGLAVWATMELRARVPMLDLRIFRYGGFSLATGLNLATTIGLFSAIFLLPLFLQNIRGLTAMGSGMMVLFSALGSLLTMPFAGRLYDRIGPRLPTVIGLLLTGVTTMWLQYLDVTTPDSQLRLILFLRGMGMGLAMMPVMTYALASVPQQMTAQASALMNVMRTVFASLGTAMFATLLDGFHKTNLATMVQTVTPDSVEATRILSVFQVTLMQAGHTFAEAKRAGILLLYQYVNLRATVLAFQTDYFISACIVLISVVVAFFLPHGRPRSAAQRGPMMS
jgi:DHA2 family multidrug resistance protein